MSRVRSVVGLVLLASGGLVAQQQTFRSGTHAVSIYPTIVDGAGNLVSGLTKDDFQVFDDDQPQTISVFSNAIRPITIVVMLDRSSSMRANFDLEQSAAVQFVTRLLPFDRARLGSFSNSILIGPASFTSDQDELIHIIDDELPNGGLTPLWDATSEAMTALAHQSGRRVVLVLTDGFDNPPRSSESVSFDDARDRSEALEVMVYGIGMASECYSSTSGAVPLPTSQRFQRTGTPLGRPVRSSPGGRSDLRLCANDKPDPHLRELAMSSGGGYFELKGTDDLATTFARVADELHRQYLLGFGATTFDGKVHRLAVRVRKRGLTVRARKSYLAPAAR